MEYNINTLIEAAQDYLYAVNDQQIYCIGWHDLWLPSLPAEKQVAYTKHDERVSCKWDMVRMMCKMVDVDSDALIGMVKAINRYERHGGKWDRATCVHLSGREASARIRAAISNPIDYWAGHYKSTGRKIAA